MTDENISNYIKMVWVILSSTGDQSREGSTTPVYALPKKRTTLRKYHEFSAKYSTFINNLICNSQLTPTNLTISLYYLYKYHHHNSVLQFSYNDHVITPDHDSMNIYLVIMSLILSNKSFDDQSYTLKTWLSIINNTLSEESPDLVKVDLGLLNSLESFYLMSLNYQLSFNNVAKQNHFWNMLTSTNALFRLPASLISKCRQLVDSSETPSAPFAAKLASPVQNNCMASPGYTPVYTSISPQKNRCDTSPNLSSINSPLNAVTGYSPLTPVTPYYSEFHYKRRQMQPMQHHVMGSNNIFPDTWQPSVQSSHSAKYQPYQMSAPPVYYVVPQQAQFVFPHQAHAQTNLAVHSVSQVEAASTGITQIMQ